MSGITHEGAPHSFGWLRQSDLDASISVGCQIDLTYFEAWERPDGRFVMIARPIFSQPIQTILVAKTINEPAVVVWPKGAIQI